MNNIDRILEISRKHGLTHIGSCLSVLPILEEIYAEKKLGDKVILDNAHAHLAHLVVKESLPDSVVDADKLIKKDIHCNREAGCDALGGSLGHGIGIAIGFALANPKITIYCVTSDGALQEGSDWEALRLIKHLKIKNIKLYANINSYTAVAKIDPIELSDRLQVFYPDIDIRYTDNGEENLNGVWGHYLTVEQMEAGKKTP